MEYRKATLEDIEKLVQLRKQQLMDEGMIPTNIDTELRQFFKEGLTNKTLIEWVVEKERDIVATGAIIIFQYPPSYDNASGKKAYVTNMYTHPSMRKKGIASKLLSLLVEEVKQLGITKVWLNASEMGQPVYEKFGFQMIDGDMELLM